MTNPRMEVLYRDDCLLAVNKPSGMLVHRGWGRDRVVLTDIVKELLGVATVHPLHRLDRGTSGVVLFAVRAGVAARLRGEFEDGRVEKRYLALVRGIPPGHGVVDHPIPRKEGGPRVPALTSYRTIATVETEPRHVSLVEAVPRTGRLHQVRLHLKHIDHPVIGDANYGKGAINREMGRRYGMGRLALHAGLLSLIHPESGEPILIEAPLPDDLGRPLERMGFVLEGVRS